MVRPFPPSEIATLIVDGREYRNWKTVLVKLEVGSPWQEFQFTAAEPIDIHSGDNLIDGEAVYCDESGCDDQHKSALFTNLR